MGSGGTSPAEQWLDSIVEGAGRTGVTFDDLVTGAQQHPHGFGALGTWMADRISRGVVLASVAEGGHVRYRAASLAANGASAPRSASAPALSPNAPTS
jgi:hypothetical protein